MNVPTLVIGLGGTGRNIIIALKKMIAENSPNGLKDYPFLKFLSVDTDTYFPEVKTPIQTINPSELTLNKSKETFFLHTDFNSVPDLKHFPDIDAWYPTSLKNYLIPSELNDSHPIKSRPHARFTFAWNAEALKARIEQLLRNPADVDTVKQFGINEFNIERFTNVFICGSLSGITSSSIFLDMAYLVRHIASHIPGERIYIYGILGLSSLFDGIQGDVHIKPNCYASLVELDHFMNPINYKNPYRRFYPAYKNIGPKQWDYSESSANGPFDFPFLFDKTNSAGFSLNSAKAFSEMVASFIYNFADSSKDKYNEIANQWLAVNNCFLPQIDTHYNREKYNKPNNYYSMGTFSILFPGRMAIQMCAYKLADVYFEKILDDTYNPQEITNLVERFMNNSKFNPNTDLLKNLFDKYAAQDSNSDSFTMFIDNRKEEFLSESADCDKKELVQKVRDWKESMDKFVTEFKQQNSVTARNLRQEFLSYLTKQISEFVDLTLRKDEANKINNKPRAVRGSLVRAQKFVKNLLEIYTDAAEKYRKEKDSTSDLIKVTESEYKECVEDLELIVDSIFSSKKKINERLEDTIDCCIYYLNAKRENLIAEWIYELFTGIKELGLVRYNGLIADLEAENQILNRSVYRFKEIHDDVKNYLRENKNYESNYLCDVLFDYKDDVEGVYQQLIAKKGEDFIFEDLSKHLKDKEENFGDSYENLKDFTHQQMLIAILRCTEEYFKEPVSKINISDKLLKNDEKLNMLLNGTYIKNASAYIGLDENQLAGVRLKLEELSYHIITIPDIYENCPCSGIVGKVNHRCPIDENEEKYRGENACSHYPNCLKKHILDNAQNLSKNLSIIPTPKTAEINILTTVAGYPLHAVSSEINNCKPSYEQLKRKYNEENLASRKQEEKLHVFGPVKFDDLTVRSEDPLALMKPFNGIDLKNKFE